MDDFFTVKQAAEIVGTTAETLRHYDRIGLVRPSHRDESSGYRYYAEQELIHLRTIELLKNMDLSLAEIKEVLLKNDLGEIVSLFKRAERNANAKITDLKRVKAKLKQVYTDYERKLGRPADLDGGAFVSALPERVLLLSDELETPSLKNLWNYQRQFFLQLGEELGAQFRFEDVAGVLATPEKTRLFAVCTHYPSTKGLTVLPAGDYLCANCTVEEQDAVLAELRRRAKSEYHAQAAFTVRQIVVTGILQWDYLLQVPLF